MTVSPRRCIFFRKNFSLGPYRFFKMPITSPFQRKTFTNDENIIPMEMNLQRSLNVTFSLYLITYSGLCQWFRLREVLFYAQIIDKIPDSTDSYALSWVKKLTRVLDVSVEMEGSN